MKLFLWIFSILLLVTLIGGFFFFGNSGSSSGGLGSGFSNPDLPNLPPPEDAPGKTSIVIPPKN